MFYCLKCILNARIVVIIIIYFALGSKDPEGYKHEAKKLKLELEVCLFIGRSKALVYRVLKPN